MYRKGEMGKGSKVLPHWSIHISATEGLASIGRCSERHVSSISSGKGWGICKILLPERLATSATPSIQIVGVESLQNSLLTSLFWIGPVCTDSFVKILVGRGEDKEKKCLNGK